MASEEKMADIAVIGMACRFPGDAKSPSEFYDMLVKGRSGWSEVPRDRFNIDAYWHPSHERKGTIVNRGGHFLSEDVGLFDAPFFSMTKGEADAMDPQHRLLLEATYECLENAGIPMEKIAGSETSCFAGGFAREYNTVTSDDITDSLLYTITGNGITMMSNRLSWFYDLRGPSMTIDTACSSALVAVSLACQDIRKSRGSCRQSIVVGSNMILIPDLMTQMTAMRFLSPDSHCYSFDDRANGYARGEGVGALILKHVDDAIRDGDCIRAIIRNAECNQDGKTPGITLPSSSAQVALIRKAYQSAGLDLDVTGYFEAHGTGTAAGDPLEVAAIASAFERTKPDSRPLIIGSVKPNIGHLEGGAGIASLIKTILALESGVIPPSINFQNPNPRLGLAERNLQIVTEPTPWPTNGVRRASVNSFGYGGANSHVILDDAHHYLAARGVFGRTRTNNLTSRQIVSRTWSKDSALGATDLQEIGKERPLLFVLSAPEQSALSRMTTSQASHLQGLVTSKPRIVDEMLEDLAFTYGSRRSTFQWRTSIVSGNGSDLATQLENITTKSRAVKDPGILFCFTGQGAQWYAMGRELLAHEVFRNTVTAMDQYLHSIDVPWSLWDELTASADASNVNDPIYAQPLCTTVQIALVDLLRHWEVAPKSIVGHSSGEIAAAYAAGALSAQDAVRIALVRGRLCEKVKTLKPDGGMLAVGLSREDCEAYIATIAKEEGQVLCVGCVNGPESITVSGTRVLLDQLEEILNAEKVFVRRVAVPSAYHSEHMELVAPELPESLPDIKARPGHPGITIFSSVTGNVIRPEELGPNYFARSMGAPCLFYNALQSALQTSGARRRKGKIPAINMIIEIGPHAALAGPIRQTLHKLHKAADVSYTSMLRRKECAQRTALTTAGLIWATGAAIKVDKVNSLSEIPSQRIPLTDLPKYPWNHSVRYWHESALSKSSRFRHAPRTDLLGEPVLEFNSSEPTWKNYIRIAELPWISDHTVQGNDVYPAAGMICAAIEGANQIANPAKRVKAFDLADVIIKRALIIPPSDTGVEVFTRLKSRRHGTRGVSSWFDFTFVSLESAMENERQYTEHCSGSIQVLYDDEDESTKAEDQAALGEDRTIYSKATKACTKTVTAQEHYDATTSMGLAYGPTFQGLKWIKAGANQATFEVEIQDTRAVMPANYEFPFVVHPTLLDAALQSAFQAAPRDEDGADSAVVPTEVRSMRVFADIPKVKGTILLGVVNANWVSTKDMTATIKIGLDKWERTVLELNGCIFAGLGDSTVIDHQSDPANVDRRLAAKTVWKPAIDLLSQNDTQQILGRGIASAQSITAAEIACTRATTIFVQRALRSLTPETEMSLHDYRKTYLEHLRRKHDVAVTGALTYQDTADQDWLQMTHEEQEKFLGMCKELYPVDMNLLCTVGESLPAILAGTQAPLPLMLADEALTRFYTDASCASSARAAMREIFDQLGHKQPDMRVLEIGAGTGSITLPVLEVLSGQDGRTPRFGTYTFTDVSSGWFEKAQELLKEWSGLVEFQKLDIEQDPFAQGFQAESFDIICASNVLHATKRLDVTLAHCHKLLKPGGKIVIGELTWCSEHYSLMFGALPGWWLSEDDRTDGPIISQQQWDKQLQECGFNGLQAAVAAEDTKGRQIFSTMISTKPKILVQPQLQKVVIVRPVIASDIGSAILNAIKECCQFAQVESLLVDLDEAGNMADRDELSKENIATISLVEAVDCVFAEPSEAVFENIQKLITKSNAVFWCACNNDPDGTAPPAARAISGLLRTAMRENPCLKLYDIHLQARPLEECHVYGDLIWRILGATWAAYNPETSENEISEINGALCIPRIVDEESLNKVLRNIGKAPEPEEQYIIQPGRPLKLKMSKPNKVDRLHFVDDETMVGSIPHGFVEIEVRANSINRLDVEVVSNKTPGLHLGIDVSGVVSKIGAGVSRLCIGDEVALTYKDAFRTHIRVSQDVPQIIPSHISLTQAAAVPFVYTAAYYGIFELARISSADKVLITQASGGLGQAMVILSRFTGAEVYVTSSSAAKRRYLESHFNIASDHILDCSSASFAKAARRCSRQEGFDVILNTLGGDQLTALCNCLAPFGRFVNYNQEDVDANASLQMRCLGQNIMFSSVNTSMLIEKAPQRASRILEKIFWLLRSKAIEPISPTAFEFSDMKKAFAVAQDRTHIGKIVVSLTEKSRGLVIPVDSHPLTLRSDATYVLSGGLGGIGQALACYLADHGAKHLVLLSRTAHIRGDAVETIEYLKKLQVQTRITACDVANKEAVQKMLDEVTRDMPPIKGVIQGAMNLQDGLYETMSYEQWKACTRTKIEGTWNLHELMPRDVDFFVMLSSIAGIAANAGQTNYAAGNTYQDAMAHYRRSLGLNACTIDLGAVGGFGWLANNKTDTSFGDAIDRLTINPEELLTTVKSAITGYTPSGSPCPAQLITGCGTGGLEAAHLAAGGKNEYDWLRKQARFAYLRRVDAHSYNAGIANSDDGGLKTALMAASSISEAANVIQDALTAKLAKSMLIAVEEIDTSRPVSSYGVDSLVAAEMRNWCAGELKAAISVFEFLNMMPITTLALQIAQKSSLVPETVERTEN